MRTYPAALLLLCVACGGVQDADELEADVTSPTAGINEFTSGTAGWIELYNRSTRAKDVSGWSVDDIQGGSAAKVLPAGSKIPAKGKLVVAYGGINKGGADQVRLLDKDGKVIDQTGNFYAGVSTQDACFGRFPDGGDWAGAALASCTKGAANVGAPATSDGACAAGTFGGVAFTKAEACKAIDFVNKAAFSKLARIGLAEARVAYDCKPDGSCGPRAGAWKNLDQLQQFGHGTRCAFAAFAALKSTSAAWDGSTAQDTIASTFRDRSALSGNDVTIERAYVSEYIPISHVEQRGCVVARDAPNGTAWITICDWVNAFADDSGGNYTSYVGKWISTRGQVAYDTYLAAGPRWAVEERAPVAVLQCGAGRNGFTLTP